MKKLISIVGVFCLVVSAFGTGVTSMNPPNIVGQNPSQNGFVTFAGTNQSVVTTFPYAFPVAPVMSIFPQSVGQLPFTNTITPTNFTLLISGTNVGVGSNNVLGWVASTPYERVQIGSQVVSTALNITNVSFPVPFSSAPFIQAQGNNTNTTIGVSAITATNFTLTVGVATTVQWEAVGPAANPGPNVLNN